MCLVNGQGRNSGSVPPLYIPLLHRRHRPINNENNDMLEGFFAPIPLTLPLTDDTNPLTGKTT